MEKNKYTESLGGVMLAMTMFTEVSTEVKLQKLIGEGLFWQDKNKTWQINIGLIKLFSISKLNDLEKKINNALLLLTVSQN